MDCNVKLHKHISIWWQYPSSGQEAMYLDLIVSDGRGITTQDCAGTTYQYLGWWPLWMALSLLFAPTESQHSLRRGGSLPIGPRAARRRMYGITLKDVWHYP